MVFTWSGASLEFLKVSLGGLLAGVVICWLYGKSLRLFSRWSGDDPATQTVLLMLLPFASYLIAEHLGTSGILAAVAAGMTISRSGIIRQAPLAMRLRANSVWQMLEFVFNGMVFLMLGLQLPGILQTTLTEAEVDNNVNIWILLFAVAMIYLALIVVRFGWLLLMQRISKRLLKKRPMEFSNYSLRELLVATFAGVRGAVTLAGVLSIPLFLPNGENFPARYELVFLATGVILFSLLAGVVTLPLLLKGVSGIDKGETGKELRKARSIMAKSGIDSLYKMEERLAKDTNENIDPEVLKEVSSRVIGQLRRRLDDKDDVEQAMFMENLERRLRLNALRAERAEVYHLRATKEISDESMRKLLRDLDLLEALLIEKEE